MTCPLTQKTDIASYRLLSGLLRALGVAGVAFLGSVPSADALQTSCDSLLLVDSRLAAKVNIPAEVAAWLPLGFGAEVILDRAEPKNRLEVSKELVRNYPPRFRDQRIGGEVTFAVRVDTTGMVSGWHMLESSGYAEFDNVARMVIRKMRYKPLRSQNQCAVPALLLVPIVFKTMG